ncbi:uncharacterized protein ARMOST_22066 [Armillaria ostoyae]|uniref:Uncharacterized protein n=1 Tax=Armillaria ostoyae TaxID=47428 RepID=A0A284SBT7_ARMOS|nr:uncharacterized protein ARMOST_22066 [Armillaria ostoyae]
MASGSDQAGLFKLSTAAKIFFPDVYLSTPLREDKYVPIVDEQRFNQVALGSPMEDPLFS